jgi:hypothetical protein
MAAKKQHIMTTSTGTKIAVTLADEYSSIKDILSTKSTPASPTTPSTPSPKIEIEGTLAIAYGSVKLTSHYPHNVTWIDSLGNTIADGGLSEMFVIDGTVFGFGNDGTHYQHSGDRSSGWAAIDSIQYAVLKSTAKRIIVPATLAPTRPVSA